MNPSSAEDTDRLIGRHLDGLTGSEECAELSAQIEGNTAVCIRYLELAEIHATLAADDSLRDHAEAIVSFPARTRRFSAKHGWAVAAAVALTAIGIWHQVGKSPVARQKVAVHLVDGEVSQPRATSEPVAVLKRAVSVEWQGGEQARSTGETLGAGWLRFKQGTVQVEFLSGALLTVQGPAELRLDTGNSAFLQNGRASAHVPEPAHGFRLDAPELEVEDLGTAFGLEVSSGKAPEVHVFEGSVSLTSSTDRLPRKLEVNQAVKLENTLFQKVPLRVADFPMGEDFARQASEVGSARLAEWNAMASSMASDPDALACFNFDGDPDWQRMVKSGLPAAERTSHGQLVGAARTAGRWPGKRAVEFRGLSDRLRFSVPGAHPALTLMVWVRVDSLPNDYNSLLLPTEYAAGSVHWAIERGGEIRFTMLNDLDSTLILEGWDGPVSGPAITRMDYGRWVFLVTTYDSASGRVNHYCDGRHIGSGEFQHRLPAVLGNVEFANWGAANGKDATNQWFQRQAPEHLVRNFVGRLDSLTILRRALGPEEISTLYQSGKP